MKLQYLGTAAAEGVPAMFCECAVCKASFEGRNIRTRSQALIDGRLLIDFPPDTYMHMLNYGIPLYSISSCLITHSHSDHLYAADLEMRCTGMAHADCAPLTLYGTAPAGQKIKEIIDRYGLDKQNRVFFEEITPFTTYHIEGYAVTPLKAYHDPATHPVIYHISDGEKSMLYCNDTGWLPDETFDWLEKHALALDFISLDCTCALLKGCRNGHMSFDVNVKLTDKLKESGALRPDALMCSHHFSHNGLATYDQMVKEAEKYGFLVSYDGMNIEI